MKRSLTTAALFALVAACGGSQQEQQETTPQEVARRESTRATTLGAADQFALCEANTEDRQADEYDTSGDDVPDVRKVFKRIGSGVTLRLVLICREADLNADGRKDVVRVYNDEGRPTREESDRNFDGRMDSITVFDRGIMVRTEVDSNYDGKVDLKTFYENGNATRAERDTAGRSTSDAWRPDRWEYFEGGHLSRMGADLDGDGVVDRWDRDEALRARVSTRDVGGGEPGEPGPDGGVADGGAAAAAR